MKRAWVGIGGGLVGVLLVGALAFQLSRPAAGTSGGGGPLTPLDRIIALDLKDINVFIEQVMVRGDRVEVQAQYLGILDQAPKTAAEWQQLAEQAARRIASGAGQRVTVVLTLRLRGEAKARVTVAPS